MNLATALSIASASAGVVAAFLALRISSAPGSRELRWFALAATLEACFNLANICTHEPVSDAALLVGSRFSMFFAGLHTAVWFKFFAVQRGRRMGRLERAVVAGGIVLAIVALVPGALVTGEIQERHVPWLGATYRDGTPTPLGELSFVYLILGLGLLFVRCAIGWRRGERDAGTYAIAIGTVVGFAIHDSLAAAMVFRGPYLLDFSLVVLVLVVGAKLTSRFVENARALEISSRRLAAAQEQLVKRERLAALGELAAMVAHEVRNPLGVVFNALSGLRKARPDSEEHQELLRIAQEEADRIRGIISDLLDFARPRPLVVAPVAIADVATRAVEAARIATGSPREAIEVHAAPDVAPMECDEQLLRQAIINLTTNALQSPGRHGPVQVFVDDADGSVAIRVVDDGEGIAETERERVFTPFYSTRATGTGLGLAMVRRTAQAHEGDVELSTTPGGGATVTLKLPRKRHAPAAQSA